MQHDLGWSRTFLSGTFSAALITAALVTIPIGRWLDRHRPQGLFLVRSSVACLFVLAWGHARSRPFFAVTWIVLGSCQAVLFYDAAFTVLTKRFHGQERSRAVTAVTLMGGLASTIFAPLTAFLAHSFGWRRAVFVLATILAAVTWPSFLFGLRQPPGHRQESGPPERVGLTVGAATKTASTAPREAFRSRAFWLLTIAYLLSAVTTFGVAVHLVAFLHERGMP